MRLSAIDSIQHGLLNLRANWQLVPLLFAQSVVITVISLLGLVPIVMVMGLAFFRGVASQLDAFDPEAFLLRIVEAGFPLLLAFLAAGLVWTLAFIVYCYFQGGILGTLAAGERQGSVAASAWKNYRVFSLRSFLEAAESLTWPVFWLLNLFLGVGLAAFTVVAFGAAGAFVLIHEATPVPAQIGLGCFVLLALVLFLMFLSVWMQLALAELATGTRGALAASRAALATTGRRLGGVALLFLLMLVVSMAVGLVFAPFSMILEVASRDDLAAYFTGQVFISLAQWLVGSILGVGWSAALVALVAGEKEQR